jgi:SAM-dependent methyltransferase
MFTCKECKDDRTVEKKFEVDGYAVLDCTQCRHRFAELVSDSAHVEVVYGDDYFEGGGAGYSDYLSTGELLVKRGKYYSKILEKYTTPSNMLDVGAAAGFLLKGFTESGWTGTGIEPNPKMAQYGKENFGLDMYSTPLEDFESDQRFHLISMIQVLPHLYDLNKGLEKLASLTAPNGYWLIETWNKNSATAWLFGEHWHEYSPPSVLHWFSPESLRFLLAQYGMEMVAGGRPSKKVSGQHAKSLINYKVKDKPLLKFIFSISRFIPDQWEIPYPAEDLFWILLKKK